MFAKTKMISQNYLASENARAYPASDARRKHPTLAKNGRGLPHQEWAGLKKVVQKIRLGTVNVGSLTGRSRELADLMDRRKVNILCVQETRWKGNKSKELGEGCKLIYSGANPDSRNEVGIVLDNIWREDLVGFIRRNDRIMRVKLCTGEMNVNVVCAYAPQVSCTDLEKEQFWRHLGEKIKAIPPEERVFQGGDLNGHNGAERGVLERIDGGWRIGERSGDSECVIDFALGIDLAIANTFFQKMPQQYITYKSEPRGSQIDFLLCRRDHLGEVKNCKVVNGESVSGQHRLVILDCKVKCAKRRKRQSIPKIKWWKLKEVDFRIQFTERVINEIASKENANKWWEVNSEIIRKVGEELLGKTAGKGVLQDKEMWWWNGHVQEKLKAKKEAKKRADTSGNEEYKLAAKRANKQRQVQ